MSILKAAAIGGLLAIAVIESGAFKPEQELREETYIVQRGDTLWTIGETFIEKNTGGYRYLPEFIEGIKENNQWLVARKSMIYPGDKLKITYFVKKEGE